MTSHFRGARRLVGIVLALVLAITLLPGAFVSAQPLEEAVPDSGGPAFSNQETAGYAAAFGVNPAVAAVNLAEQDALAAVVTRVAEQYPDRYAFSEMTHADTGVTVDIHLTGGPLPSLDLPAGARLHADAPWTADDAAHALQALGEQLLAANSGAVQAMATWHETADTVEIVAAEGTVVDPTWLDAPVGITVDVVIDDARAAAIADETSYGGTQLERKSDKRDVCTSGYSVRHEFAGFDGMVTAGHCTNSLRNEGPNASFDMDYQFQSIGTYGDFQLHRTDHADYDDFYYTSSSRKDVSGVYATSLNMYVCAYGRRTNSSACYVVKTTSYSKSVDSDNNDTNDRWTSSLACADEDRKQKGDSGGPWYSGRSAYGVHHGNGSPHGHTVDCFSQVWRLPNAMDVYVRR